MQGSFLVFSILTCSQNSTMSYFLGGQNETKELTGSKIIGFWMHYIYRLAAVRIPFCLFWHFEVTARKGVSRSTDGELVTTLTKTKMDTRCRIPASSRNCKTHDKYICLLYRDIKFVYIYIYVLFFFNEYITSTIYIYTLYTYVCIIQPFQTISHLFVSKEPELPGSTSLSTLEAASDMERPGGMAMCFFSHGLTSVQGKIPRCLMVFCLMLFVSNVLPLYYYIYIYMCFFCLL